MPKKLNGEDRGLRKTDKKKHVVPPVIISLKLNTAAAATSLSVPYLKKAIEQGRLKATVKKQPGKGRGVILILVKELERFVSEDENFEDLAVSE